MQTAFFKAHYYLEYMAPLISSYIGKSDAKDKVISYINEVKSNGHLILPPDINHSEFEYSIEGNDLRFALAAISGMFKSAYNIIEERNTNGKFKDLYDLLNRISINKLTIDSLVYSGALDSLIEDTELKINHEILIPMTTKVTKIYFDFIAQSVTISEQKIITSKKVIYYKFVDNKKVICDGFKFSKKTMTQQDDGSILFNDELYFNETLITKAYDEFKEISSEKLSLDLSQVKSDRNHLLQYIYYLKNFGTAVPNIKALESIDPKVKFKPAHLQQYLKLMTEKAYLDMYISGHPLDKISSSVKWDQEGQKEVIAIIRGFKKIQTGRGADMAFVSIESLEGNQELLLFPKQFESLSKKLDINGIRKLTLETKWTPDRGYGHIIENVRYYKDESD